MNKAFVTLLIRSFRGGQATIAHYFYAISYYIIAVKEYVCDNDWTIREITPSEGYLLDTTVHKVGAEPQLYTVEHNQTANDVTEQVMKGNIAIIKHTDDGETQIETPENGATFEIYLKSSGSFDAAEEDERDVIVCDENGFGQTKDMPYGVYTVHQTSGWEGRELMKNFDVYRIYQGYFQQRLHPAYFKRRQACWIQDISECSPLVEGRI